MAAAEDPDPKRRKICDQGTGEVMHIVHYTAKPEKIAEFELTVQRVARCFYDLQSRITDVRVGASPLLSSAEAGQVCHPRCGEICFVVTLLSCEDLMHFLNGPLKEADQALRDLVWNQTPTFTTSGCLMPSAHTLESLLRWLVQNVRGRSHTEHDVPRVQKEVNKWFPRAPEYQKYIHWNKEDPKAYTRNLIYGNDAMDVVRLEFESLRLKQILMCWPPHSKSTIHDHNQSSCWVALVEGEVVEVKSQRRDTSSLNVNQVQYQVPQLDRKFIESEMKCPSGEAVSEGMDQPIAGAIGRCGPLKELTSTTLTIGCVTSTYANNDIALHRVDNRTDKPAYTLHVYAPPLEKIRIFNTEGDVHVHCVHKVPYTSVMGECPSKIPSSIDVTTWNQK